ncbi:MAG: TMEM198/TM7SF3 family protein [Chloroflexi bacterium]|nr:TMEM198/TM7SF3 family protein [Chloroflexota bacterium]
MWINVLVGTALLLLGRKLFWLFVAGVGFMVAINLAPRFFEAQEEWVSLLIALGAGLIGALLAVFLQKLAVGLAGFLAGGYVLVNVLELLDFDLGTWETGLYIVGGIIGAGLVAGLFEWALIILSSLTGASMIGQALDLGRPMSVLLPMFAFIIGVVIQTSMKGDMRQRKSRREREREW